MGCWWRIPARTGTEEVLNAEGSHYNRKTGDYHCHRGPKAGQGTSQNLLSSTRPAARKADSAPSGGKQRHAVDRLKELKELKELKALKDQGLITPEQCDQKSAEILGDL